MPTSVLLAVLAAAGLLALAPALVRRYDATERLVAERALSTARVLTRAGSPHPRRRRTVPGRRPINPPTVLARQVTGAAAFAAGVAVFAASNAFSSVLAKPTVAVPVPDPAPPAATGPAATGRTARSRTAYRRRRALLIQVLLICLEVPAAVLVARPFWIAVSVSSFLLVAYVVHLRNQALLEQRRRRAEVEYARWVHARQAAVRREQARRAQARRELLEQQLAAREEARELAREDARRAALRDRYDSRASGQ